MNETLELQIKRLEFCRDCIVLDYDAGREEYNRLERMIEELKQLKSRMNMSYYPDKNQIPTGFEEWSFTNMPEDGEIVEVLSYGKVETMRFDKPYMAFNPSSCHVRLGGWALGCKRQEGITHFKRINS